MIVRSQIVYSRLCAIVRELAETVGRTARSRGLTEGRRYAAAVLTGAPQLAAQVQFGPEHAYLVRDSAATVLDRFAFNLFDGDVVIVGDPYSGGSTPQMLTVVAPLFFEGELVLFPAVRAQMADLAGEFPGDLHPFAAETWQDAVRFTPLKIYRHGVLQRDALRFVLRNSRAEKIVAADLEAIVAALRASCAALVRLMTEHGRADVETAVASAIAHSRRVAAADLEARFGGRDETAEATIPGAGGAVPLKVRVAVGPDGLTLDLAGTGSDPSGPFNMTPGQVKGYGLVAALAERLDEIAFNDGLLQLVTATAPKGSIADPVLPAATGLSDALTGHRLAALVRRALGLAERLDGPAPAIVAFRPIGAEENPPVALDLAFPLAAQGWGPPVLAGRRTMPSAEEMEARERLVVLGREFDETGAVRAAVRNDRMPLEANFFLPQAADGATAGSFTLTAEGATRPLESATIVPIAEGGLVEITYPAYGTRADG
ncbi:hydantoinase B/oxoprolinase family protein [Prosthecomicrobium pneumaticum]|uniref:N-methylhydantoinase B n=1 Tax=Prosthecomicrobium pneumaticum TaxID=81895 RepID=A0A7W9CU62_9HYPH|nr:hydantoinase B/oxoprolinase family protein [Prosthecomicrobium pneumaticum]MBB5751623.1 N-methylhydantoinase B [Prosthecomicrobium pneumaticum]